MRAIYLANEKKRDAEVGFQPLVKKTAFTMTLSDGREKKNVKFIKSLAGFEDLAEKFGDPVKIGEALIAGDPEIDMERVGKFVERTRRLWMTADNKIAYRVNFTEVVYDPNGGEKERRDFSRAVANIKNGELPLQWTGRLIPKLEAMRKFVFTKSYQIRHTSGLTYDFLFEMAKELHEKKSLMLVGGGKKGNDPLRLTDGGEPYRGFLEGRIDGNRYCLILHLTNLELKAVPVQSKAADPEKAADSGNVADPGNTANLTKAADLAKAAAGGA
jgi:hypothetical protein